MRAHVDPHTPAGEDFVYYW